VLEKFNQKHESIDNANIHLHAKFVDERKILQGETKKGKNKDIIGSGALFTSMSNPHPDGCLHQSIHSYFWLNFSSTFFMGFFEWEHGSM